jgi:hypothetical protein
MGVKDGGGVGILEAGALVAAAGALAVADHVGGQGDVAALGVVGSEVDPRVRPLDPGRLVLALRHRLVQCDDRRPLALAAARHEQPGADLRGRRRSRWKRAETDLVTPPALGGRFFQDAGRQFGTLRRPGADQFAHGAFVQGAFLFPGVAAAGRQGLQRLARLRCLDCQAPEFVLAQPLRRVEFRIGIRGRTPTPRSNCHAKAGGTKGTSVHRVGLPGRSVPRRTAPRRTCLIGGTFEESQETRS